MINTLNVDRILAISASSQYYYIPIMHQITYQTFALNIKKYIKECDNVDPLGFT